MDFKKQMNSYFLGYEISMHFVILSIVTVVINGIKPQSFFRTTKIRL